MRTAISSTSLLLVVSAAAAALAACADETTTGPAEAMAIPAAAVSPGPDLGQCDEIAVAAGSKFVLHAYAEGVQIYRKEPGEWVPVGPSATLYADAAFKKVIGTHSTGPTWTSNSGSFVIGQLNTICGVSPDAIPWLLLDGIQSQGPGAFKGVTQIQRVNTVGGLKPIGPGAPGELKEVPYTAEYYFYRAP